MVFSDQMLKPVATVRQLLTGIGMNVKKIGRLFNDWKCAGIAFI
jgi:hypothetical protein